MAKHNGEETVIAHGVRVEGEFNSEGNVVIEGDVQGVIRIAGDLKVGEASKIAADVTAANAIVAGEIRGNLSVAGKLELLATSKIIGDVAAETISVLAGAQVNGRITMDGTAGLKSKKKEELEVE